MNTKKRVPGRMIPEKIDILMQFIRQARQGLSFFAQSNEPCVDGMKARRRVLGAVGGHNTRKARICV